MSQFGSKNRLGYVRKNDHFILSRQARDKHPGLTQEKSRKCRGRCFCRWEELRGYAANTSYAWPLAEDKQAGFDSFARIYNATGTQRLTTGTQDRGEAALRWLHAQVFAPPAPPGPSPSAQGLYVEVVLDECSNTTAPSSATDCRLAELWTAVPTATPNATIFRSALSVDGQSCYAMNVPGVPVHGDQVLAYGDSHHTCDSHALQNTFVSVSSGLLAMSRGYTTSACSAVVRTNDNLSLSQQPSPRGCSLLLAAVALLC